MLDARHTCDRQWWPTVLPAFHEIAPGKTHNEVLFAADIATAQVAQVFAGVTKQSDNVDMRNAVFYHGTGPCFPSPPTVASDEEASSLHARTRRRPVVTNGTSGRTYRRAKRVPFIVTHGAQAWPSCAIGATA